MPDYFAEAKHPITGVWETAAFLDGFFGDGKYGVKFEDEIIFNPEEIKIETKENDSKKCLI